PTLTTSRATVHVYTCDNTIRRVFGGGNAAAAYGVVTTIDGGRFDYIFGGGNGESSPANIGAGGTNLTVNSGVINYLFGGSNEQGTINGTMGVAVNNTGCTEHIKNFFAGGNLAVIGTQDYPVNLNTTIACGTVFEAVYGGSNLADIYGNVTMTINGGRIDTVYAGSKGVASGDAKYPDGKAANIYGSTTLNINAGEIGSAFGGSNINGDITGTITVNMDWSQSNCDEKSITDIFGASNLATYTHATGNYPEVNIIDGTVSGNVFGGGNGKAGDPDKGLVTGNPIVTIGDANGSHKAIVNGNVYGGGNNAAVSGSTQVIYNDNNANSTVAKLFGGGNAASVSDSTTITLTRGKVTEGVYGGCNSSGSVGVVTVALNGGQVGADAVGDSADVYGGGYGAGTTTTDHIYVTLGNTTVYGDIYGGSALGKVNASTTDTTTVTISGTNLHGSVFGGGKGDDNTQAVSYGNAIVNINAANDYTGIYGGANINGLVTGDIELYINANIGAVGDSLDIFGGGYGVLTQTSGNVTVNVGDSLAAQASDCPTIYGDIYGGSALGAVNDEVADSTTVNINNGTIHGNIYGGGLGKATLLANGYIDTSKPKTEAVVNGTVHVNIGTSTQVSNFVTIDGQVFGCNNLAGSPKGHVYVDVYKTAHIAANTYPTPVPTEASDVDSLAATAFAIGAVYGGGNLAHYTTSLDTTASTHVYIHGCDNTIQYVYGGGNAASSPATDVIIDGGRFNFIFGGGNGAGTGNPGADIDGDATVTINGGIVYRAFGGSNTKGHIGGSSNVNLPDATTCTRLIHEIFGGGNEAPGGSVDMVIPCGTTGTGIIYAGANNADMGTPEDFAAGRPVLIKLTVEGGNFTKVFGGNNQGGTIWGDVELHLKGGTIDQAFGGNNLGGNIKGSITVYVDDDESTCPLILTDVYGGGYNAAYMPADTTIVSPQVYINHIKSDTLIRGSVYGGGYGETAIVTANPRVVIGDLAEGHDSNIATIAGDVYGGGNAASVVGTTTVIMQKANSSVKGALFGGGNAAGITGSTNVTLTDGTVANGIYGGCNSEGEVTVATQVNIDGGTVGASNAYVDVFGSGKGHSTTVNAANVYIGQVNIVDNVTTYTGSATIYGDVYGGSEMGSATTTTVNLNNATALNGDVYGGGKGQLANAPEPAYSAEIRESATVIQNNLTLEPGKNIFGACNINGTADSTSVIIKGGTSNNVFGGGNLATMQGNASVLMEGGSVDSIFGGGNLADIEGNTYVTITGGTVRHDVYGGGLGQVTTVTDSVTVNIGAIDDVTQEPSGSAIINGNVYGGSALGAVNATKGASLSATDGKTQVNLYGGTVTGSVYGGGLGDNTPGSLIAANVYGPVTVSVYGGKAANVFGANNLYGAPQDTVTVFIIGSDAATEQAPYPIGKVYGGGNLAAYGRTPAVIMTGGTTEYIYGGGYGSSASVGGTNVTMAYQTGTTNGGTADYIFGGGEEAPVTGSVAVNINGGTVTHDVYGGGALANTNTANWDASLDSSEPVWNQGGWASGMYNGTTKKTKYSTSVTLTGGKVHGNVYGGGLGRLASTGVEAVAAMVYGDVTVELNPELSNNAIVMDSIFGANNINGTPKGDILVHVYRTYNGNGYVKKTDLDINMREWDINQDGGSYDVMAVYGGGNKADYIPKILNAPKVIIEGCDITSLGSVYGGGNAAAVPATDVEILGAYLIDHAFGGGCGSDTLHSTGANVGYFTFPEYPYDEHKNDLRYGSGTTGIKLLGGYILNVFGGSDTRGEIYEETNVYISESDNGCELLIGAAYGGGRKARTNGDINFIVDCQPNKIATLYGGAEEADITGNVNLYIMGGDFQYVYGGNKKSGVIGGNITVNIQETADGCKPITIDYLYGGCYEAPFEGDITVNLKSFTSIGKVYGGSFAAPVKGNVQVNINEYKGHWAGQWYPDPSGIYIPDSIGKIGTVFGGGDRGKVIGNTEVNIGNASTVQIPIFTYDPIDEKYIIDTSAEPEIKNVLGAHITGNVYGGGNNADVTGNTNVYISAIKSGDTFNTVDLKTSAGNDYEGVKILGSVYGGGNLGSVGKYTTNANGKPTTCVADSGVSTVVILGEAEIGPDNMKMITASGMPDDYGHVFGGSRGTVHFDDIAGNYNSTQLAALNTTQSRLNELAKIAYVDSTQVVIGDHAFIKGSVYGGSENGHVLRNTHVTIKDSCQIGSGDGINRRYLADEWRLGKLIPQNTSENALASTYSASLPECASWTYDGNHSPYDIYKDENGDGKPDAATDGHTFYGNVFGGGSGYYPYAQNPNIAAIQAVDPSYADGLWLRSAGVVEGNTRVDILGGHILTSVYGGNEQTDVLGKCTVNISGGTVGVPRTLEQMKAHPVTCYVFGAGKGDQRINFNTWTNVASTIVNITDSARIF
ncbi:MAG: hypothetical protein J6W42_03730, partial [Bacteroidaceae bacterium]|nr:hypothetical protein [Bacteroidaceae bacterium]